MTELGDNLFFFFSVSAVPLWLVLLCALKLTGPAVPEVDFVEDVQVEARDREAREAHPDADGDVGERVAPADNAHDVFTVHLADDGVDDEGQERESDGGQDGDADPLVSQSAARPVVNPPRDDALLPPVSTLPTRVEVPRDEADRADRREHHQPLQDDERQPKL